MWKHSEKLPNGISVSYNEQGDYWLATLIFQRECFEARGASREDAINQMKVHIGNVIPVWEWKVEHAQNVVNDMKAWVAK